MRRRWIVAVIAATGLAAPFALPDASGAAPPAVLSIAEGRTADGTAPVLLLVGERLKSFTTFTLTRKSDQHAFGLSRLHVGAETLVLRLPPDVESDGEVAYSLTLSWKKGAAVFDVTVAAGEARAGSIEAGLLSASLRADLDDAATMEGKSASFFADASNLATGTLATDRFSAYADLAAEQKMGTAADQVASGDHDHDARYFTQTQLSSSGTLNAAANPVDWTRLKGVPTWVASGVPNWSQLTGVPAGFADGIDDVGPTYSAGSGLSLSAGAFSLSFAGTGSAASAARSDHDHDARYFTQTQLSASGTINSAGNPVDWTKLKGVPAGLADGVDNDTQYAAGSGLGLAGTTFSVSFAGTGTATTAARSDHDHDATYPRKTDLAAVGTINASSNPIDWSQLKNVPSGFADGADDAANYSAGAGLSLAGTTFAVSYGGTGSASTAARSDHDHDARYLRLAGGTVTGNVNVLGGATATSTGVVLTGSSTSSGGTGVYGTCSAGDGVDGFTSTGIGVYAVATGSGNALIANQTSGGSSTTGTNNVAIFQSGGGNVARIDKNGRGYFNGGTQTNGADFAEAVEVDRPAREFEPGDVLIVDPTGSRRFALSKAPRSPLVAGVYSTRPAVLATNHEAAGDAIGRATEIPLGVVGILPTKVCDEGGPIEPGDLLVTSSLPGHAMKAPAEPRPGTLLGKALGRLERGRGRIEVLVGCR